MRRVAITIAAAIHVLAVSACDDTAGSPAPAADASAPGEGNVVINVEALTLESTTGVCYALEVWNGKKDDFGFPTPERVWARDGVCSSTFGNGAGGGISYVGTCDAAEPDNFVTLGIEAVYGQGGVALIDGQEWFNPCPIDNRCELYATCVENADTPVTFNLTIMRAANQGFFDVAVRFDQVFCSGKIDCSYDHFGAEPIMLLHDGTGTRAETAVVSLACTSGPWLTDNTELYLNHLRVVCDEPSPGGDHWALAPAATGLEGNQWDVASVPAGSAVWQYATFFGSEELFCDGLPCNKKYVDFAVGYDPAAVGCRLEVEMTVARPGVFTDFVSPARTSYPVLVGRVQLTPPADGVSSGLAACRQGGLNETWSGFYTTYTAIEASGQPFCFRYRDGTFEPHPGGLCDSPDHYDYLSVQPLFCGGSEALHTAEYVAALPTDLSSTCSFGPVNPRFACDDRHFIADARICDGFADCPLGDDERFGNCTTPLTECDGGATFYAPAQSCDGRPDCEDATDETGPGCTTVLEPCGGGVGFYTDVEACDGILDCRNGHDETVGGPACAAFNSCATGEQAVLFSALCDGWPDCDDGSDELSCP